MRYNVIHKIILYLYYTWAHNTLRDILLTFCKLLIFSYCITDLRILKSRNRYTINMMVSCRNSFQSNDFPER